MYRKRFNLNDNKENVKDWLEDVCENTGIGKSNKVKFAISACETLIALLPKDHYSLFKTFTYSFNVV
jgi:hypothetical protein